jgi:hypothetical protein
MGIIFVTFTLLQVLLLHHRFKGATTKVSTAVSSHSGKMLQSTQTIAMVIVFFDLVQQIIAFLKAMIHFFVGNPTRFVFLLGIVNQAERIFDLGLVRTKSYVLVLALEGGYDETPFGGSSS